MPVHHRKKNQKTLKKNKKLLTIPFKLQTLNTEVSDRKILETKSNKINDDLNIYKISNNKQFDEINENLQKTSFIAITAADPIWRFTASTLQIHTHPSCIIKQTFSKKQFLLINIKGYLIHYNKPGCRVYLLKDRKPYFDDWNAFYQEFNTQWIDVDLVAQFTIEPGTYIFEVGIKCNFDASISFDMVVISMSSTNIS